MKTKVLCGIVALVAVSVLFGWYWDISFLKRICTGWMTMKVTTAVCFIVSSFLITMIPKSITREAIYHQFAVATCSFILIFLMVGTLWAKVLDVYIGIEIFMPNKYTDILPSTFSIFGFLLVALAGIVAIFNTRRCSGRLILIGKTLCVIGLVVTSGYLLDASFASMGFLMFDMALHASFLFVLLGYALIASGKKILLTQHVDVR